nr:MAG TPA: YebO-like protein [Caudoviricetes sp.]DAM54274.1 MAG TPA: YebO-like protein [Caudoviricetes sp.]DAN30960.1 MAG TPA: YebO-like protein [Caudoviricetes sp.]DAN62530.1 MAG TPA: YebO-like protein [Caudoviricetes sp.]DAP41744.1 MAG TPA: YebO-like protein [Caudoviricetes sp.]
MKVKFNVRKTTAKEKLEFILGTVLIILIIWFFVR